MKLIDKDMFFNSFGTRKNTITFEGDYTMKDLEGLVQDAPYGYWIGNIRCIDKAKKLYKGEIHEYWD